MPIKIISEIASLTNINVTHLLPLNFVALTHSNNSHPRKTISHFIESVVKKCLGLKKTIRIQSRNSRDTIK